MNGILYLTANDCEVKRVDTTMMLCLKCTTQGLTLVLFYSHECPYCQSLLVDYKQLPFTLSGCRIGIMNIQKTENAGVISMSADTVFPLTHVPDIVLFVDNVPYAQYQGDYSIDSIRKFLLEMNKHLERTTFTEPTQTHPPVPEKNVPQHTAPVKKPVSVKEPKVKDPIPAYTVGVPKNVQDAKNTYTSFMNAYSTPSATTV
jgi:hypothetical protein